MNITHRCKAVPIVEYECKIEYDYCCKDMKKAIEKDKKLIISTYSCREYNNVLQFREDKIFMPTKFDYSGGNTANYIVVNYCPFCGKRIQISKVTE